MSESDLIDFNIDLINQDEALNLIEDAIIYAANITQNRLVDTSFNSAFRFLLEAQVFVYGKILEELNKTNEQLIEALYRILGFTINPSSTAQALLKFELLTTFDVPVFIPKAFPVSSVSGILFLTDETLVIAAQSKLGYVNATTIITGEAGNVEAFTINNPRRLLSFNLLVTNESKAFGGSSQDSLVVAQQKLSQLVANTSVVNASNYEYQISNLNPNFYCNVVSLQNLEISIYLGKIDGTLVSDQEIQQVKTKIQEVKHIGIETVNVSRLTLIPIVIEVVLSVDDPLSFSQSSQIAQTIKNYFLSRDSSRKYKGIVLLENIKRLLSGFEFNYLQTLKIGTNFENAVGNNFTYNSNTEAVVIQTVKVTLINDNIGISEDY